MDLARLAAAALAVPAVALPALAAADSEPTPAPTFFLLGPDGAATEVGAELTALFLDDANGRGQNRTGLRVHLHGQFLHRDTGLGGYAELAAVHFESGDQIGGLELGGLYRRDLVASLTIAVRAGLVLPTNRFPHDDGSDNSYLLPFHAAIYSDPSDAIAGEPEVLAVRLAVTPTFHHGPLFVRIDVGTDTDLADSSDLAPLLHIDAAIGASAHGVGAALELQTLRLIYERDHPDYFHKNLSVSCQLITRDLTVFGALGRPLVDGMAASDAIDVTVGVRGRL